MYVEQDVTWYNNNYFRPQMKRFGGFALARNTRAVYTCIIYMHNIMLAQCYAIVRADRERRSGRLTPLATNACIHVVDLYIISIIIL